MEIFDCEWWKAIEGTKGHANRENGNQWLINKIGIEFTWIYDNLNSNQYQSTKINMNMLNHIIRNKEWNKLYMLLL